ncbi:hypothetical protein RIVM261_051210 [Rivularia sp. IAM M-261]|nr:hypothetical protein CAL7716_004500 [Calothrix sp. PCC 7716]GJD20165.1 hypothetical protein RIVM261_051210 [Rivularia sp. IAM M-261]
MNWIPLRERINTLPLVLAGPILRRTDNYSVTVWIALKESRTVTLVILDTNKNALITARQKTTQVGDNLHVVAITAQSNYSILRDGENYLYNIAFNPGESLNTPGVLNSEGSILEIAYPDVHSEYNLPSFALPPNDINNLRIVHGSCRKLHGESLDAMASLDKMIREALAVSVEQRPHQLFLTGDQIYVDDVADALLFMLMDAAETLLGWSEPLPGVTNLDELKPGQRNNLATNVAGLTASLDKLNRITDIAKSHLFTFGEFMAMYLFAWSDVLWVNEEDVPHYNDIYPQEATSQDKQKESDFDKEVTYLKEFISTIKQVRRALANIPTYMIFDDHEITDDWNLNMAWCDRVLSKPLGRRVIQNGLLGYSICQAWGNTPLEFSNDKPGAALLSALQTWSKSKGNDPDSETEISKRLGLPTVTEIRKTNPRRLPNLDNSINWNYTVTGPGYEVVFLDTRTLRGFPGEDFDFPELLSDEALEKQLREISDDNKVTIVISPSPVVGLPFLEGIQKSAKAVAEKLGTAAWGFDPEAWGLQASSFEKFIARLALRTPRQSSRIVMLSGDVHYSFSARLQYSANQPFEFPLPANPQLVIAQFTSSSLRNEKREPGGSYSLHLKGFVPFQLIDYHPKAEILGWSNPEAKKQEVGVVCTYADAFMQCLPLHIEKSPALINIVEERSWFRLPDITKKPEWWYRVDFLPALLENLHYSSNPNLHNTQSIVAPLPRQDRLKPLNHYLSMAKNHHEYKGLWGHGKEVVGVNNLAEITFEFDDTKQIAVQTLWWRLESHEKGKLLEPFPLTRYEVSLSFDDKDCPITDVLKEVRMKGK